MGGVGGLVGQTFIGGITISNSYFAGTATSANAAAGFVARETGMPNSRKTSYFLNSYSSGSLQGAANGGLLPIVMHNAPGYLLYVESNCYWDIERSGAPQSSIGTGRTSAQMAAQANYSGWDFLNTWKMPAGNYPELQ